MQLDGATTLYHSFENSVSKFSDRPCLGWRPIGEDGTPGSYQFLTYEEVRTKARNLASALAKSGVSKCDKVGIYSANNIQWQLGIRAVDMLSASIVPIYDSLGDSAIEYIIKHSELAVALVEPNKLANFALVAGAVADQVKAVVAMAHPSDDAEKAAVKKIEDAGIAVKSWDEYLDEGAAVPFDPTPPEPETIACIMYTR